jgi:hypothetical protein
VRGLDHLSGVKTDMNLKYAPALPDQQQQLCGRTILVWTCPTNRLARDAASAFGLADQTLGKLHNGRRRSHLLPRSATDKASSKTLSVGAGRLTPAWGIRASKTFKLLEAAI